MSEALKSNSNLRKEVLAEKEQMQKEDKVQDAPQTEAKKPKETGKLILAEEIAEGHVAWSALKMYFLAYGGGLVWTTVIVGDIAAAVLNILQPWFLGEWARQYENHPASEISVLS
jgi:hypothetical protein